MTNWSLVVLAASLLMSEPAFGQSADEAATAVAPVTVTAKKLPKRWVPAVNPIPPELGAATELCWQRVQDPSLQALFEAAATARVPPPTLYQPTRFPRNPDYSAPPITPPGSPFPDVRSIKDYIRGTPGDPDRKLSIRGQFSDCLGLTQGAPSMARQMDTMANEVASRVRSAANGGSFGGGGSVGMDFTRADGFGSAPSGRAEIKARDRTLPLGFALFDQGRYEEALEQFKAASRKTGNPEASLMIGKIYLLGLGERSDPIEAVKWLKRTADANFNTEREMPIFDPLEPERNTPVGEAAMILADLYGRGQGPIAKDPVMARSYLDRAFQVGHIAAAMTLGDIYYYGIDTSADPTKAFAWYMKAAIFAHAPAAVAVAQMYAAGEVDGRPDAAKALVWYTQAARLDHPQALYALAVAFDRGDGVAANPQTALTFYKLAATQGDPAAQTAIGTYFYDGSSGLPHDPALARKWFELAAIAGDPDGMFNLAVMQAKGEGGEVDRVKASGWLKVAERLGLAKASPAAREIEGKLTPQDRVGIVELTGKSAN